jgi:hypothetical protein
VAASLNQQRRTEPPESAQSSLISSSPLRLGAASTAAAIPSAAFPASRKRRLPHDSGAAVIVAAAGAAGPHDDEEEDDEGTLSGPGVPPYLRCLISDQIMSDPVSDAYGFTYERACIEMWFARGNTRSPGCNQELPNTVLTPNIALRQCAEEYRKSVRGSGMSLVACVLYYMFLNKSLVKNMLTYIHSIHVYTFLLSSSLPLPLCV